MKKRKANVMVIKEGIGYSATLTIDNQFIATEAETFEQLKAGILDALNFTFEESDAEYSRPNLRKEPDVLIEDRRHK